MRETSDPTYPNSFWSNHWEDHPPASYGGYVQDMEQADSSYDHGNPVAPMGQPVEIWKEPLHVILDLGCTRAMGSRVAVEAMMKAAAGYGINYEIRPRHATFRFANNQKSSVMWKCKAWFPTTPSIHTYFDMVEEGTAPILFSLVQMQKLSCSLHLSPEGSYFTSPALGSRKLPLRMSTTRHRMLDLSLFP